MEKLSGELEGGNGRNALAEGGGGKGVEDEVVKEAGEAFEGEEDEGEGDEGETEDEGKGDEGGEKRDFDLMGEATSLSR